MLCGFPSGRFRFLPSISRGNTLREPREMDPTLWNVQHESIRCSGNNLERGELLGTESGPVTVFGFLWTSSGWRRDRKSTRLNSSHQIISYAVFCLKKKKEKRETNDTRALWQRKLPRA